MSLRLDERESVLDDAERERTAETICKLATVELAGLELDSHDVAERLVQEFYWNAQAARHSESGVVGPRKTR